MRISDGVYGLQTPFPGFSYESIRTHAWFDATPTQLSYVLAYLVVSGNDLLLIDVGWDTDEAFDALTREFERLGYPLSAVTTIVVTHSHPDHSGLARRLQANGGVRVILSAVEALALERYRAPGRIGLSERWLRQHGASNREANDWAAAAAVDEAVPLIADELVSDGDRITVGDRSLEVVLTPGHTPGHMCLLDARDQILFSGDHVVPRISPHVAAEPDDPRDALGEYLASVDRVGAIDPRLVLPAHQHVMAGLTDRVKQLRAHHEARLMEIEAVIVRGTNARGVVEKVQWGGGSFMSLSTWGQWAAITEVLAHLVYLARRGRASVRIVNGISVWSHDA